MTAASERIARTPAEFVALVREMRGAQKAYFKARREGFNPVAVLAESKALESAVDQSLSLLEAVVPPVSPQGALPGLGPIGEPSGRPARRRAF